MTEKKAVISTPLCVGEPYQVWVANADEFVNDQHLVGVYEYDIFTPTVVFRLNNWLMRKGYVVTSAWEDELDYRFAKVIPIELE
jgi:hypothetical protein